MLCLKNIVKTYPAGDQNVTALRDLSIEFRKNEFVSILGPSGCGKTTLLNIIGGLDQYTSGDLVIQGRSTREFRDADWDTYRNHSVGFVFQSYNLIPHQTVLANVELALTLSGVSKSERRKRAVEALSRVGLSDQLNKKPHQMSGGQMQRVAIARALVNDPEILLADEPTGALDSETSVQIMEILKEIAADRLVIMVTHNPELAQTYSTRIVRLLDGRIIDDSNPFHSEQTAPVLTKKEQKQLKLEKKKASMSFFTALSLSLTNLMTKKTRTFLTAFAGSIGIIGIALILSVSTGVQNYIDRVQEDTLSSYPITIERESVDMSAMVSTLMGVQHEKNTQEHEEDSVYASSIMYDLMNSMNSAETTTNNLAAFSEFIESSDDLRQYASSIQYAYDTNLNIFVRDTDGQIIKSDIMDLFESLYASAGMSIPGNAYSSMKAMRVWEELLPGEDGALVNSLLFDQYDLLYGTWPQSAGDVVLVVNENNEITDMTLYALGLRTGDELIGSMRSAQNGDQIDIDSMTSSWSYEELCGLTFKYILPADCYQKQSDGVWLDLTQTQTGLDFLYNSDSAITLKVSGIIRANSDAVSSMIGGAIGYTSALTELIIKESSENELISQQLSSPETDVLTGLPFDTGSLELTDAYKAEKIRSYFATLTVAEKAELYTRIMSVPSEDYLSAAAEQSMSAMTEEQLDDMMVQAYSEQTGADENTIRSYLTDMDGETRAQYARQMLLAMLTEQYARQIQEQLGAQPADALAAAFDAAEYTEAEYAALFDQYMPAIVSDSTFEENLSLLGYVDPETPSSISIYAADFASKDAIADLIEEYNASVAEEDRISYTDYVALMMSSISTIINAISYVLIAFVAISLVVSSIMIGIITYISVLERTKEIGILRAIGASKRDVSRVFNAETLAVGFIAGAIGIGVTLLMTIPINLILHSVTGITILNASLPVRGAIILIVISMALTFIAGLIPSGIAARKDPVVALRAD